MKTILLATMLIAALPALGQTTTPTTAEWQRQQAQRHEADVQRQELRRQAQEIQRLQDEQRQQARRAEDAAEAALIATYRATRPAPTPTAPVRFTPTPQDRAALNRQVLRLQADPTLSTATKTRLIKQLLDSVEP